MLLLLGKTCVRSNKAATLYDASCMVKLFAGLDGTRASPRELLRNEMYGPRWSAIARTAPLPNKLRRSMAQLLVLVACSQVLLTSQSQPMTTCRGFCVPSLRSVLCAVRAIAIAFTVTLGTTSKSHACGYCQEAVISQGTASVMSGAGVDAALLRVDGDLNESQDYGEVLAPSRSQSIDFWGTP